MVPDVFHECLYNKYKKSSGTRETISEYNVYVALTCIYYNKLSVTTGLFYSCYITHEKIIVLLHLDVYNIINYVQHIFIN